MLQTRPSTELMPTQELADLIEARLAARNPFSLIRISDGDGLALGFDQHRHSPAKWLAVRSQCQQWFGRDLSDSELHRLRSGLLLAASRADAIGIPEPNRGGLWREARLQCERFNVLKPTHIRTALNVHFDLQRSGALRRLIDAAESIAVVTCRPTVPELLREITGKRIRWIEVPADTRTETVAHARGDTGHLEKHAAIRRQCFGHAEHLTLVGAGILGKLYTTDAARGGAVALDIGSVFDGWAGMKTRGSIKSDPQSFRLI